MLDKGKACFVGAFDILGRAPPDEDAIVALDRRAYFGAGCPRMRNLAAS